MFAFVKKNIFVILAAGYLTCQYARHNVEISGEQDKERPKWSVKTDSGPINSKSMPHWLHL